MEVLEDIRHLLEEMLQKLDNLKPGGKGSAAPKAPKDEGGGGGGGVGGIIKGLLGAVGTIVAAVGALVAFPALVAAAVSSFVSALNPGLMQQFTTTLDNLQATIGYAFEPVIGTVVKTLREFAQVLLPLMQQIRPVVAEIIETLAGAWMAVMTNIILQFKVWFTVMTPVIQLASILVSVISQLVEAMTIAVEAWMDAMVFLLGLGGGLGEITDALKQFKTIIAHCVYGLTFLTASVMRAFSMFESLGRFKALLEKRLKEREAPAGGLVAAPKDVTTSSAEDIARKMSERAFAAMGGGGAAKTDTEILDNILEALKDAETMDWEKLITNAVRNGMKAARDEVVASVPGAGTVESVIGTVRDVSSEVGGRVSRFIDDPIASLSG